MNIRKHFCRNLWKYSWWIFFRILIPTGIDTQLCIAIRAFIFWTITVSSTLQSPIGKRDWNHTANSIRETETHQWGTSPPLIKVCFRCRFFFPILFSIVFTSIRSKPKNGELRKDVIVSFHFLLVVVVVGRSLSPGSRRWTRNLPDGLWKRKWHWHTYSRVLSITSASTLRATWIFEEFSEEFVD